MGKILITGGTGEIGAALVEEFSKDYEVFFTYLNNTEKAEFLKNKFKAIGFKCDSSDDKSVNETVNKINGCDILINNSAISQIKMFQDISLQDWDDMIKINLTGIFYFCKAALPYMINKKSGNIINLSSILGTNGASCEVHYSASKAGVIGFTKALAKEVGLSGVRVNCIAPGVIQGGMNSGFSKEELDNLKENTSLAKLGTPYDVAHAARFLSEAEYVTGQILGVDGGFII